MKKSLAKSGISVKQAAIFAKNRVFCDICGNDFMIDRLKMQSFENGVQVSYFACPHCKAKYITTVTDPELRALIFAGNTEHDRQQIVQRSGKLKEKYLFRTKELN